MKRYSYRELVYLLITGNKDINKISDYKNEIDSTIQKLENILKRLKLLVFFKYYKKEISNNFDYDWLRLFRILLAVYNENPDYNRDKLVIHVEKIEKSFEWKFDGYTRNDLTFPDDIFLLTSKQLELYDEIGSLIRNLIETNDEKEELLSIYEQTEFYYSYHFLLDFNNEQEYIKNYVRNVFNGDNKEKNKILSKILDLIGTARENIDDLLS